MIWIKNTNGSPSASLTFALIAFFVTTINYILSMFVKIGPLEIRAFDPGACASYLTPILALYFSRRYTDAKISSPETVLNEGSK